jgi:hypothetical protein
LTRDLIAIAVVILRRSRAVLFDHQNLPLNKNYGVDPDRGKTIFGFCVGSSDNLLSCSLGSLHHRSNLRAYARNLWTHDGTSEPIHCSKIGKHPVRTAG